MAPSADVAAVEGLLSGLALSDAGAGTAAASAPEAGAAAHPDQLKATATSPSAPREAAPPDADGATKDAPAPASGEDPAEAPETGQPDLAAAAPAGDAQEKLVQEAEQLLAQLQLGASASAKAGEAPLSEHRQQAAEGPQVAGTAADTTAANIQGAGGAEGREDPGRSRPAGSKRGSLTKKVPHRRAISLHCSVRQSQGHGMCGVLSVVSDLHRPDGIDAADSWL